MTMPNPLDERQSEIWRNEREQIQRLLELLAGWEIDPPDLDHLRQALNQLDEFFLLVFVGEFNSGKSALINALLGKAYLAEGVTPTTDRIHILKHGEPGPPEFAGDDVRVLRFPVEILREVNIVDTPGTNAVLRRHEAIARDFVPRSDLVIFVTSADRPFTESERAFLDHIRQWGKKVSVVINKADILDTPDSVDEIVTFVRDQLHRLLGLEPEIFPLSAREAKRAAEGGADHPAGFAVFVSFLEETLSQDSRVRLKLLSPLGVALNIARRYREIARTRLQVLSEDVKTLEKVQRHLTLYEQDTRAEVERHLARVEADLLEMRLRGEEFIDDKMRLLNLRAMLDSKRLRQAFEREVVSETPERLEGHVREMIDWLVERELRQWRLIADELSRRRETDALRDAARQAAGGFAYNRRQLIDTLGEQAERVIASYDPLNEAARMASTVQDSVAMVSVVEVGAVGLGLVLKAILVGAAADATGLLAAGVLGALGFAIIPYRRGVAKRELRQKMENLRTRLAQVLSENVGQEVDRSVDRLREAIQPYRRFVLDERARLEGIERDLGGAEEQFSSLQSAIEEGEAVS